MNFNSNSLLRTSVKLLLLCFFYSTNTTNAQSVLEKKVLNLSERKFLWMIHQNLDSLESILDDKVVYVHSNGWSQNRKEIIDDFKSKKIVLEKIEIQETSVRSFENTYIVIGKGNITGIIHSESFSVTLIYTEVYILKNGNLLLVSRHANKI